MATAIEPGTFHERRHAERRRLAYAPLARGADGVRISWGGVWGGVLVALGVLFLSGALAIAVGASRAGTALAGTGAAAWAGATLLIALFLGGMVSTRVGAIHDDATSLVQGVLVWVVSAILAAVVAASGIAELSLYGGFDQLLPPEAVSSGAWIGFGSLLLSLLAAVLGAASGRRRSPRA
jgi:hypothetical protein